MSKTVQARVSDTLKQEADSLFLEIGMTTSDAIRLFLQQSVNLGALPFKPVARRPNAETLAALREATAADALDSYDSFAELREELDA